MKPVKLIKHIKTVGWKNFTKEFKKEQEEAMMDQKTILRIQAQGLTGTILFSLVTIGVMAYNGFWTISGIFLFNSLFVFGQLKSITAQLNILKGMEALQNQFQESTTEKVALENIKG